MADLTIDDLLTSYTADQLYLSSENGNTGIFVDQLVAPPFSLPADQWKSGGIASSILRIVAILYAMFSVFIVSVAKFGFLITSTGGWLRLLAKYSYGVTPRTASFASGVVTLSNSSGGLYSYAAGDLAIKNTTTGKIFKNLAPVTINPGPGTVVTNIPVQALEIGTVSNSPAGQINALVTPQLGLTVTNPVALVGQDDETDPELIQRCLDALGARSVFGPGSAYRAAVFDAKLIDGSPTSVNRARISPFSSTGEVNIVLASPTGAVTADDITAVLASVQNLAEVDTDTVSVTSAVSIPIAKVLTVWAKSVKGKDTAFYTAALDATLIQFTKDWPIGGRQTSAVGGGFLFDGSVCDAAKTADESIWLVTSDGINLPLAINHVAALATTYDIRIVVDS